MDYFKKLLKIPSDINYINNLKLNGSLRTALKCEKGIMKHIKNPLEITFAYIDICMAVNDPSGMTGNFIMAALYLIDKANKSKNPAEIYAYKNCIMDIIINIYMVGMRHLVPTMQLYSYKLIIGIISEINSILIKSLPINSSLFNNIFSKLQVSLRNKKLISESESQLIDELFKRMVKFTNISPLGTLPTVRSCDTIYLDLIGREFLPVFMKKFTDREIEDKLIPPHKAQQHILDGAWKGWANVDFDDARLKCMKLLLKNKKWSVNHVQGLLEWPLLTRTSDGWLNKSKRQLNLKGKPFTRVEGISFDIESGEIKLLLEDSNDPSDGLFDMYDVQTIFKKGIYGSIFTLEQPDTYCQSNPFQEMKYGPPELVGTNVLATLLHADYLLKFLSIGTEVCSKTPFEIKNAEDGFLQRLPNKLRDKFTRVSDIDKDSISMDTAHRFWIEQSGKLVYEVTENGKGMITFKLDDVKMRVKKHLLKYNKEGKLVDADEDEKDDTPEAKFAKEFTKYYDDIGYYFPELLRLKELLKLSALYTIIQSQHTNYKNAQNNIKIDSSIIRKSLIDMRKEFTYPIYTNDKVEECVEDSIRETMRQHGCSRNEITGISSVRSNIESQLADADSATRSNIIDVIARSYDIGSNTFTGHIDSYLSYWKYNSLTNAIEYGVTSKIKRKYNKMCNIIKNMGVKISPPDMSKNEIW